MGKRENKAEFWTLIVSSGVSGWERVETTYRSFKKSRGGVRKTEGIKSEIDDQQMMQPDKEVINKEKRAVEPAPEEAGEVQIDQDETPTEVEENEDKTMGKRTRGTSSRTSVSAETK